jgi:hypothetical protein
MIHTAASSDHYAHVFAQKARKEKHEASIDNCGTTHLFHSNPKHVKTELTVGSNEYKTKYRGQPD